MGDMPDDPVTSLREGAVAFHELYLSYVDAGFTESQALTMICHIISAAMSRPSVADSD